MNNHSPAFLLAVVASVFGTTGQAHAFGFPCCNADICWVEKTITCYRPEVRCREVQCTVMKKVCREVVEMKKCIIPITYTEMQKRTVFVYGEVKEEVEREIYVAVDCPTCEAGCGHCCKPNPASYKTTIKCLECKPRPQPVEITEPVCKVRTEEKLVPTKKLVVEEVPETIMKREFTCEMVRFELKVTVPVCVPNCGGER